MTEGVDGWILAYDIPLSAQDTRLLIDVQRSDSEVLEKPFDVLKITSDFESASIKVEHPFIREVDRRLSLGLMFDHRKSQTFLLGEPFLLSVGADPETGESVSSALRFETNWFKRDSRRVLAMRSQLSFGVDVLDASRNDVGPDSDFMIWLCQLQWAQLLTEHKIQLLARADMQMVNKSLLVVEKFPIGGARSVRGYRESVLVTDQGLVASIEARLPVLTRPDGSNVLQLAVFSDYGAGKNKHQKHSHKEIASWGLGVIYQPLKQLRAEAYWADQLSDLDIEFGEDDLQDDGFHLSISYQFY